MTTLQRFALSPYQYDIWLASTQLPQSSQYTLFGCMSLFGAGHRAALREAMKAVAMTSDALHLRVADESEKPWQWSDETKEAEIAVVDFSTEEALNAWIKEASTACYELNGGRLFDLYLLTHPDRTVVYARAHHIICDAWGIWLYLSRVLKEHLHFAGHDDSDSIQSEHSYLDIVSQSTYLESEDFADDAAFFADTLEGAEPALFKRGQPSGSREYARHHFMIPRQQIRQLRAGGHSPFQILTAAISIVLARYHRSSDIIVGIPVLNRRSVAERNLVGQFANTLPLRLKVRPEATTEEYLAELATRARQLIRHERMPLGRLARDQRRLFDVTVSYLRWPQHPKLPAVDVHTVAQTHAHDTDAIAIWASDFGNDDDVRIDAEYAKDVFDHDLTIESFSHHVQSIFNELLSNKSRNLDDLRMLSGKEYGEVVVSRNATDAAFPAETTISTLFTERATTAPTAVAVVDPSGVTTTYEALLATSNRVAAHLRSVGIGRDDRVAVLLERGPALIPAIFGIQRAGAAYVPLRNTDPNARVLEVLRDCNAKAVFVENDAAKQPALQHEGCLMLSLEETLSENNLPPPDEAPSPSDLAYVIYTSGSTGKPKGVMVEHRSVVNRLWWMQRQYPIGPHDVILQKTPTSFDVSVWELFWWSFTGAQVALLAPGDEKDPQQILKAIRTRNVTTMHFVPSMLTPFLDLLENQPTALEDASTLKTVFSSGEALSSSQATRFKRLFGDRVRLVNLYGPTEATVDVSFFECRREEEERIPIGRPIDNTRLYVLRENLSPQPIGVPGELFIGGVGVARGYLEQPDLTAERFIKSPFEAKDVLYRTGDNARWLSDGNLEYLGRIDSQVKIRGNRVEPGEVEDQITRLPGIADAAVIADTRTGAGTRLLAYYVAKEEQTPESLRQQLGLRLPDFMVPAFFIKLDELPKSANGKLDRSRLPKPVLAGGDDKPRNEVESKLRDIWAGVLEVEKLGIHDDFFSLGGDSITILRVRSEANRRNIVFEVQDLLRHPTIAGLAQHTLDRSKTNSYAFKSLHLVADSDRAAVGEVEDAFPMSQLALGMLFHTIQRPTSRMYRDVFRYQISLEWDEQRFREAVQAVVDHSQALRSTFDLTSFSEPLQVIASTARANMKVVDVRNADDEEAPILAHMSEREKAQYDHKHTGLYLVAAFTKSKGFEIVFSFHHAILDGWSVATLIDMLLGAYQGKPRSSSSPPLAAYAAEERNAIRSPVARAYWIRLLDGANPTHVDGFVTYETKTDSAENHSRRFEVSPDLSAKVTDLARSQNIPPKTLFLAAHCLTLHLYSQSKTVVTGLVSHGRPDVANAESMLGLFLNTLPVRAEMHHKRWLEYAIDLRNHELDSHAYRRYPLAMIQTDVGDTISTVFNYVRLQVLETHPEITKIDVREETNFPFFTTVVSDPVTKSSYVRIDAASNMYSDAQVALIGSTYLRILDEICTHPTEAISFDFLVDTSTPPALSHLELDVIDRFDRQVRDRSDLKAVVHGDHSWTYSELDAASRRIAAGLCRMGAVQGDRIGVSLTRSREMIATVIAVLRSGLICVPLDARYPAKRLEVQCQQVQPFCVIVDELTKQKEWNELTSLIPQLITSEANEVVATRSLDDIAIVLFTSGSTGNPKAVELTHRMWANYTQWQLGTTSGNTRMRTVQFAPLSFDMSFQEIFATLCAGAELHIVDEDERLVPSALLKLVERYSLQRLFLPFVAFQRLAEASNELGLRPKSLAVIVSSGEQLKITEDVRKFLTALPNIHLENQYGPTETHQVTYHPLAAEAAKLPELPPIGRPIEGAEVYVLDERLHPVPAGVEGAIYVGGHCLARGYLNAPDLTEASFVRAHDNLDKRLYKTGDLGKRLPTGEIVWLGRGDRQVKVRGFRIEPAEVELATSRVARQLGQDIDVAVVARTLKSGDTFLVAFLRGNKTLLDTDALRRNLLVELPEHMVPTRFQWIDAFPRTQSGKRNYAALEAVPLDHGASEKFEPPQNDVEKSMCGLFMELLDLETVGRNDDFFSLGGTSITAMRLVLLIEKRFGASLDLAELVQVSSVKALAERVRSPSAKNATRPLVPLRAKGSRAPLFLVHPLGGHILCYLALTKALSKEQPVYALQAAMSQSVHEGETIEQIAAHYLEEIRTIQPNGPYSIGGWSFGGFVAYEMAIQIARQGRDSVRQLFILDSITMHRDRKVDVSEEVLMEFFYWELVWFERAQAEVAPLPKGMSTKKAMQYILQHAVDKGVLPIGTTTDVVANLYNIFKRHWSAIIDYKPDVLPIDLVLFRAQGALPESLKPMHELVKTLYRDPSNGWQHWTTGTLDVVDVPGDHLDLMNEPNVRTIATHIERILKDGK